MPPGSGDATAPTEKKETKKVEKSYLASAVDSINPWTSNRSTTPTPKDAASKAKAATTAATTAAKRADDHSTNTLYGQSFKRYPPDCPPLNVMWFHAVDVPKRKPNFLKSKKKDDDDKTKQPLPKKFVAFSKNDSRSIENAYQKLLEELEDERGKGSVNRQIRSSSQRRRAVSAEENPNTSIDKESDRPGGGVRVPVNEDFLFDVDIEERELAPVYWLGPIYEVRRGTWFYQEGSTLRPCEENLAAQLEEGYLKIKPWTYPESRSRSNSGMHDVTPKPSSENLKAAAKSQGDSSLKAQAPQLAVQHQPQTYRLFGTYMNSIATYQDSNTAWLSSESVFSWVTSTVYQRFAGGGYMNGVKLVRGYSEPGKPKDGKDGKRPPTPTTATLPPEKVDDKQEKSLKRRSAPPSTRSDSAADRDEVEDESATEVERRGNRLKREFSSFIETSDDPDKQEEQIRKREEQEIQDDYNGQDGETQGRDIEHLVLVTHGIGQLLGLRMESVNFVHDVNMLRKTIKAVYAHSADLKTLNKEPENGPGNCKIQVLPVCWRHLLDFPKQKEKKGETDLGDLRDEEDDYPSLEDITIEGVAFARSLISDLALDVLLYQSAYREQIVEIVLKESNRIYKLFLERNPDFKGKVHIIGHSLGSAIMFDILCRQREKQQTPEPLRNPLRFWPSAERPEPSQNPRDLSFDFDVEDFYCLGSPIGLFQMLKGRTIAARGKLHGAPSESPLNSEYVKDPFLNAAMTAEQRVSTITGLPFSVSSPKVGQLFNIFHPSDPISYRLEPLISPAMSSLKPQALPYTKKGIFGAVAPQGLSGLGVKVGQSVSGLWSSFSAGIASNILNRSLGLSNQDVANFNAANAANSSSSQALGPGAGTNIVGGGVIDANAQSEKTDARKRALARQNSSGGIGDNGSGHDATLIDDDLETLYARFQKKRIEDHKNSASRAEEGQELGDAWAAEELKAQKLRREEAKVRALNRNGRVDYSIQESALDFNPINTIASHMSYWQDEDVSHFMISQLLSKKKEDEKRKPDQATVRI
ncbi:DDHD domain-containing protein [Hypoxylon sp. EC38]|nr:DDHD domain-containing protein [Hypoxylon sp. EC38]